MSKANSPGDDNAQMEYENQLFDEAFMDELGDIGAPSAGFPPPPAEFDEVARNTPAVAAAAPEEKKHSTPVQMDLDDGKEEEEKKKQPGGDNRTSNSGLKRRPEEEEEGKGLGSPSITRRKKKKTRKEIRQRFKNRRSRFFEDEACDSGGGSGAEMEVEEEQDLDHYDEGDGFVVADDDEASLPEGEDEKVPASSDPSGSRSAEDSDGEDGGAVGHSALLFRQRYADQHADHKDGKEEGRGSSFCYESEQERNRNWYVGYEDRVWRMQEESPEKIQELYKEFNEYLYRTLGIDGMFTGSRTFGDDLEANRSTFSKLIALNSKLYKLYEEAVNRKARYLVDSERQAHFEEFADRDTCYSCCAQLILAAKQIAEMNSMMVVQRTNSLLKEPGEFRGRGLKNMKVLSMARLGHYADAVAESNLVFDRRFKEHMWRRGIKSDGKHIYMKSHRNGLMKKEYTVEMFASSVSGIFTDFVFTKMKNRRTVLDILETPEESIRMQWNTDIICMDHPYKEDDLMYFNLYTLLAFTDPEEDPMYDGYKGVRYISTEKEKAKLLLHLYSIGSKVNLYDPYSIKIYADLVRPDDVNLIASVFHYQLVEDPEDPLPSYGDPIDGKVFVNKDWVTREYRHPCPERANHFVRNPAAVFKERLALDAQLQRHRAANPFVGEHWNVLVGKGKTGKSTLQTFYQNSLPNHTGKDKSSTCVVFKNDSGSSGSQFNNHDIGPSTIVIQLDELTTASNASREELNIATGREGVNRRQAKGQNNENTDAWCHFVVTGNQGPTFCLKHNLDSADRRLDPKYTFWMHMQYNNSVRTCTGNSKTHGMAMIMAAQQHSQFARWNISMAPDMYADDYVTGMVDRQQQMRVFMTDNIINNMLIGGQLVKSPGSLVPFRVLKRYVEAYAKTSAWRNRNNSVEFMFDKHTIDSLERLVYGKFVVIEDSKSNVNALKGHGVTICGDVKEVFNDIKATYLKGIQYPPICDCMVADEREYFKLTLPKRSQFRGNGNSAYDDDNSVPFMDQYTVKPPEDPSVTYFLSGYAQDVKDFYFSGVSLSPDAFKALSGSGYKGDKSGGKISETFETVFGEKNGLCQVNKETGRLEFDPGEVGQHFNMTESKNLERYVEVINRSEYGVSRQKERKEYTELLQQVPPRLRQRHYCGVHPKVLVKSRLKDFVRYKRNPADGKYYFLDQDEQIPEEGYMSKNELIMLDQIIGGMVEFDEGSKTKVKWKTHGETKEYHRNKKEIAHRFLTRLYTTLRGLQKRYKEQNKPGRYMRELSKKKEMVATVLSFVEKHLAKEKKNNHEPFYHMVASLYNAAP